MKKETPWILAGAFLLFAWVAGCSVVAVVLWERNNPFSSKASSNPADYKIKFGLVTVDADENATFSKETDVVPLRYKDSGFRFGFQITPPDERPYSFHCIYHFPSPPKILSGDSFESTVPSTTMQTKEMEVPGGTFVSGSWFDPGDPLGEQSIDVFINGKFAKTIKFTVIPDH